MGSAKKYIDKRGVMGRLTERNGDGGISVADLPAALKKLAELEDAEQNGRPLIKAAKEIAEFCDGAKDCDDCLFFDEANDSCALDDTPPSAWDVWEMSAKTETALREREVMQ